MERWRGATSRLCDERDGDTDRHHGRIRDEAPTASVSARKMPDLKLLRSKDGTTTLMRDHNNVVLKRGMSMLGEITDVSSIQARR